MKMTLGVVAVLLLVGGAVWWGLQDSNQKAEIDNVTVSPDATVLYYGEECPHCKDVEKFIEENHVEEKVSFERKEVWHDKKNAAEMQDAAKVCGLSDDEIGVPFMFAKGKCFVGTPDVEGFFQDTMK